MAFAPRHADVDTPEGIRCPLAHALRRYAWPLAVYAASRALVLLVVAIRVVGTETGVLEALANWDGGWYLSVASYGYPAAIAEVGGAPIQSNIAFFPAYPFLVASVAALGGLDVQAAAVIVANLAGACATVLLWAMVRWLEGQAVADRAVGLFCCFPAAGILSMAYAESIMLAASIGCLYALLRHRWLLAGVAGALATAARPNAAVVVACCLWQAGFAIHRCRAWRALVAPLLACSGILGYFGWLWKTTGEPAAWFIVQRGGWGERIDFGAQTLSRTLRLLGLAEPDPTASTVVGGLALGVVVVGALLLWRWRPPALLSIYTAGVLGMSIVSRTLGTRPRFVFTAFPLLVAVARAVGGSRYLALLAASTAGLVLLTAMYTTTRLSVP